MGSYSNDGAITVFWLTLVIILAAGVLVGGCIGCNGCVTAESSMTGVVVQYGSEGVLWKTNEGQLSLGFTSNGTGTVSTGDTPFCVETGDGTTAVAIEKARDSGKPVKLWFNQVALPYLWRCGTTRIVYRVDEIGTTK